MAKPELGSRFSEKKRVPFKTVGESRTQQHMRDETDINNIVARHIKGAPLGNPNATRRPMFGDFSSVDFMHMQNSIADIDQTFRSLPARVRSRFNNDPYQVVRFVEKSENRAEAIKLGLVISDLPGNPEAPKAEETPMPRPDPEANPHKAPSST